MRPTDVEALRAFHGSLEARHYRCLMLDSLPLPPLPSLPVARTQISALAKHRHWIVYMWGVSYDQDLTLGGGIALSTSSISAQDFAPRAPDELDIDTDDDISGAGKVIARLLASWDGLG